MGQISTIYRNCHFFRSADENHIWCEREDDTPDTVLSLYVPCCKFISDRRGELARIVDVSSGNVYIPSEDCRRIQE